MTDILRITRDDAIALSSRSEGDLYDRKAAAIDGKKVEKIAVAFANADGGEFVIGIADDKEETDPAKRWSGKKMSKNTIMYYNACLI